MARREWQNPSILERIGAKGPEWYIRYRVRVLKIKDGKPVIERKEKWYTLGLQSEMTRHKAEREKARIMREVNGQIYTLQSHIPFPDFVAIFKTTHVSTLAAPTQNNYHQQLDTHILPAFRDKKLYQIGPLEIQQFFQVLESGGVAKTTRSTIRGVLGALFKCAKKWRYLETPNPMEGVSIGGGPARIRECRIPDPADVLRLMDACSTEIALLIETLCATGMRISEAAGLTVADLDFERKLATVRRRWCRGDEGDPKSEAGRRELPLDYLAAVLERHVAEKRPEDRVFLYKGEPIQDNTLLANYVSPRMVKLGIKFPGFGWHTFRRLHLSRMRTVLDLFDLRRQAGHADIRTTQRYIADDLRARAAAVAKVIPFEKKKAS